MRSIKTSNVQIKINITDFENGDCLITVDFGQNEKERPGVMLPREITKTKFTDAAFIRHIMNFFIKD